MICNWLVKTHEEMVPCGKKVMELKEMVSMRGCGEVDKISFLKP